MCAAEDAGRLRDALGVAVPVGLPARLHRVRSPHPLVDLVARYARTHGPFLAAPRRRRATASAPSRCAAALERARGATAGWCAASSGPTASSASGATTTCSASSAAARSPRCARRSSRSTPPPWPASCPRGTASATAGGASTRWSRWSAQLQGAPLVGVGARARHPAGPPAASYEPADLDALCTVGRGRVGRRRAPSAPPTAGSGSPSATRPGCCCSPVDGFEPDAAAHRAARRTSSSAGASFWADLARAAQQAGQPFDDPTVLAALWDLVWAGVVTNDSLAPAAGLRRRRRPPVGRRGRRRGPAPAAARGPAGWRGSGPPAGAGRWSLVAPLLEPLPTATEAAHARALQLLERYGVLTREAALGEGAEGGFAGVYPVLKALEERGQVRRGYFVAGLGAAQFALPGAVDRLRGERDRRRRRRRSCWPPPTRPSPSAPPSRGPSPTGRPARAAGALVVLAGGRRARLPRAGRPQGPALPGRRRRRPLGRRARPAWSTTVGSARSRSAPSTASTSTRPRPRSTTPSSGAGFQQAYKGWSRRARAVSGRPEGFEYRVRKDGDVVIHHHGRQATVLRGTAAARFLADVERRDPQEVMARATGNYRRGNERTAPAHPRNKR